MKIKKNLGLKVMCLNTAQGAVVEFYNGCQVLRLIFLESNTSRVHKTDFQPSETFDQN